MINNDIGVCIPTYNRPKELHRLLMSISQNFKVYVSDNGSMLTDSFKAQHSNVYIKGLQGPPISMFANWNSAAKLATTAWIAIPSDDDIYYQNSFNIIKSGIETYKDADIIIFGHHVVDDHYKVLSSWKPVYENHIAPDGFFSSRYGVDARMPSIFFKRRLLEKLEFFDEDLILTGSDSDLIQRALLEGQAVFIPEIVAGYRVWRGGATHKTIATDAWMSDIETWTVKLEKRLKQIPKYEKLARKIRSEIYARNLLAGINHLRYQKLTKNCFQHLIHHSYPIHAKFITQLKIFYAVLLSLKK